MICGSTFFFDSELGGGFFFFLEDLTGRVFNFDLEILCSCWKQ